jgi:hypothetical protein
VANTLNLHRKGAVGFIGWLDVARCIRSSAKSSEAKQSVNYVLKPGPKLFHAGATEHLTNENESEIPDKEQHDRNGEPFGE